MEYTQDTDTTIDTSNNNDMSNNTDKQKMTGEQWIDYINKKIDDWEILLSKYNERKEKLLTNLQINRDRLVNNEGSLNNLTNIKSRMWYESAKNSAYLKDKITEYDSKLNDAIKFNATLHEWLNSDTTEIVKLNQKIYGIQFKIEHAEKKLDQYYDNIDNDSD